MDRLSLRHLRFDGVEEADELLMPVARHAAADHLAFEHVERGEQGGGAVALVVVGHGAGPALLHRQARLGAIEGLDLALLVDREDDGVSRRIDVEADDVLELGGEVRIVGQLELAHPMGLETMRSPDALHRADADPDRLGHRRRGPVGRLAGGGPAVRSITRAITAWSSGGLRDGRVLSRSSPSTPACMKRSCQRQTTDLLLPSARMISAVPKPSAVSRTIRPARHASEGCSDWLRSLPVAGDRKP